MSAWHESGAGGGYDTFERVLAMPWHRYQTAVRLLIGPDKYPEHFGRMTGSDALMEAERIIARQQRNHERHEREWRERHPEAD